MNRNTIFGITLFSVLFILFSVYYYADFVFALPYGLHDEAQADRLAVAMQYYDRGMNFFLPRTYHIYATDGITPIEFPIHSYTAALLGKIFGREHISLCFRLLTVSIGYFGLLSLYLMILRATKDILSSLLVPFMLLCSPAFAYYLCNYMPDAAAASISFIGVYFFTRYVDTNKYKKFIWGIVFLTLAALIKTSVGVVLLSVMGYSIIDLLFLKRLSLNSRMLKTGLLYSGSLALLVAYYFYNQYLADTYKGYIFLMRIIPFADWAEAKHYFTYCLSVKFVNDYFTIAHYPVMLFILIGGSIALWFNKETRSILILIALMISGSSLLTILFGHQLIHHDYYFVSMWMPAITITLALCFAEMRKVLTDKNKAIILNTGLLSALFVIFFFGSRHFNKRITMDEQKYPGTKTNDQAYWMRNGSKILDDLGIGRDSTIYVLDENAANVGLVYFDRRGMNAMKGSWEGNIFNVRSYMKDRNIRIMVVDARKVPALEKTYERHFYELYEELYRDDRCAVFYLVKG